MPKPLFALLVLGSLAGCGDAGEDAGWREPSTAAPADAPGSDAAQMQRDADENRRRFLGDGKGQYTPRPVRGF